MSASDPKRTEIASDLEAHECGAQLFAHQSRLGFKLLVVDSLHGRDWVNRRNLDPAPASVLNNDIAGQHCANLVL